MCNPLWFLPCPFCPFYGWDNAKRAYKAEQENARLREIMIEEGLISAAGERMNGKEKEDEL